MMFPSTACLIQHKIGAHHAWGFDLERRLLGVHLLADDREPDGGERRPRPRARGRRRRHVEHHRLQGSRDLRAVRRRRRRGGRLGRRATATARFSTSSTRSTAAAARRCACRPAAACDPSSHETIDQRLHYVKQDGQTVFKFAVRKTEEISRRLLERNGLTAGRPRPVRLAPGQPPHHPVGDGEARRRPDKVDHQHRAVRQHHRGHDSAGAERRRLCRHG